MCLVYTSDTALFSVIILLCLHYLSRWEPNLLCHYVYVIVNVHGNIVKNVVKTMKVSMKLSLCAWTFAAYFCSYLPLPVTLFLYPQYISHHISNITSNKLWLLSYNYTFCWFYVSHLQSFTKYLRLTLIY